METVLYIVHVLVCLALLPMILLQSGKGGGMAGFGAGGSQTVFGTPRGASVFLSRLTSGAAIVFMLTSLGLAYFSSAKSRSVVDDLEPPPAETSAPAATSTRSK